MINEKDLIDLCPPVSNGGGGGGTDNYNDLTNRPKINNTTLSGNKSSADLSLVGDVQVNGTSVVSSGVATIPVATTANTLGLMKVAGTQCMQVSSSGLISGLTKTAVQYADIDNSAFICKGTLNNLQNTYVRAVAPACTVITASDTTATLVANTTYAHAVSSSGCTYTLTTPSATDVYSGFILMIDTTNSASIAFQTDGSPATSIVLNGNPTIATGKKYTVTGQYDVINSAWQLFIIDYSAS